MLNTLKMELYNLRRTKSLRVLVLVALGFAVFAGIFFAMVEDDPSAGGKSALSSALWDTPLMFVFSAIFCSLFIGADFHNRTVCNQIASGHSRLQVLLGKGIAFAIGSIPIIMMNPLVRTLVYTMRFGWGGAFTGADVVFILRAVGLSILLNTACSTVYILFAFLFKDTGKTVACSIPFFLVLEMVCSLLGDKVPAIARFYEMTPFSISRLAGEPTMTGGDTLTAVLSALVTIVLFIGLTWLSFRKSDLK